MPSKDTAVRWTVAKGLARIAERLPSELTNQVIEAILRIFTIHSSIGEYDLPAIAEWSWHGACLSIAEMARRTLIDETLMSLVMGWMSKARYSLI